VLSLGPTEYSFVSSMGYVDKGDRMANSYSINCRTWKWTKKIFFHLFDLSILNSYIHFSSLGVRKFHIAIFGTFYWGNYWHTLDMNGMCKGQQEDHLLLSLDLKNMAGDIGLFCLPCEEDVVCVGEKGVIRNVSVICERCDVALCYDRRCFADYHNKADP